MYIFVNRYLFLAFILLMGRPYLFALLPILLIEAVQLAKYTHEVSDRYVDVNVA